MEKEYFIEMTESGVEEDLRKWLNQYDEVAEYQKNGYKFIFVRDMITQKITLYVKKTYQLADGTLYVIELSTLKTFKNMEEAQANWNGIVEYYMEVRELVSLGDDR